MRKQELASDAFLEFTRSRDCILCSAPAPSEPHHFPPKGRLGYRDDSRVIPVCRACHKRCHGETIALGSTRLPPWSEEMQSDLTADNLRTFIRGATDAQWNQFGKDRKGPLWLQEVVF